MPATDLRLPGRFRGAVFDFDGLLVDSEPGWGRAEARLLARRGLSYTEADRRATVGRSIDATMLVYARRLGLAPDAGPALEAELLVLAGNEYLAGFDVLPGAAELVASLRGRIPLALASNTGRRLIDVGLARTPFANAFDAIVTSDDVARAKPAPDLYLLACTRIGVRPADAIAFEDSLAGVHSARAAGLTVVAVPSLAEPAFDVADVVVASLADLRVDAA